MKVAFLLPTFRWDASEALEAAALAEGFGIDGVFAYDHLWPMGSPERPALAPFPVLARVAARHESLVVGPLVARVGLCAPELLVAEFEALAQVAPGRVVAALGTGDKLSAAENEGYGLVVHSVAERQRQLEVVANALAPQMPVWIGAGAPTTNEIAARTGAELNYWQKVPAEPAGRWNWAGTARDDLEVQLDELAEAGSTWAVFSPTVDVARLGAWARTRR